MDTVVTTPETTPEAPAPKHKHLFAPGYDFCQCGAARCGYKVSGRTSCKKVATASGLCKKHEAEKDQPQPFWSADRIADILKNSDQTTTLENGKVVKNSLIIYRFLQRMFERQTQDEQQTFATSHDNGVGFAGCDARLLSDIATGSLKFNTEYKAKYNRVNGDGLTIRQAKYVASRLTKYVKTQLVVIANEATDDAASMPEVVTAQQVLQAAQASRDFGARGPVDTQTQFTLGGQPSTESVIDTKIAGLKLMDPAKYYDPFDEGERLSEEAALAFWTKRFGANA